MDAEGVLRHFGANKKRAIEVYAQFVNAALAQKSQQEYCLASEGRMLGSDEFLDEVKQYCKSRLLVMIEEAIIVIDLENGIRTRELAEVLGLDSSLLKGAIKRGQA